VGKDCGYVEAAGAFNVHEERPRGGHQSLEFVPAGLGSRSRVEEIFRENHFLRV